MTDEQHELRSINWNEVFAFTHIFKSFRMAVQPSKLLLALAAILAVYFGGRIMDGLWGACRQYTMPGGIDKFIRSSGTEFDAAKKSWLNSRAEAAAEMLAAEQREVHDLTAFSQKLPYGPLADAFRQKLSASNSEADKDKLFEPRTASVYLEDARKNWKSVLSHADKEFDLETDRIEHLLGQARKEVDSANKGDHARRLQTADDYRHGLQLLTTRKKVFCEQAEGIRGKGIFATVLMHEVSCLNNAMSAVWQGNISGGLVGGERGEGFVYWVLGAIYGGCWLLSEHWLFGAIFLVLLLSAWALFGGAIHRIAALHAAREEKMSMNLALRFAAGKFFSFFTAPLLPLAIILVVGLLLAMGGLAGNLWGFGAILMGAMFFLAILLGLLIAFLTVGLVAGFGLMYPTIAVEGSDSFDAISRSFSYIFARPWRSILYGGVALFYGAVCYLFVRVFTFLTLASAHYFVNWGVFTGGDRLADGATRLDVLWSAPTMATLHGTVNWAAMTGAEKFGAVLLTFWIHMTVSLLGAFLLSYAASSTTVIYYLLRRKVDATDLDDVYIEEGPQDQPPTETPAEPQPPAGEGEKTRGV